MMPYAMPPRIIRGQTAEDVKAEVTKGHMSEARPTLERIAREEGVTIGAILGLSRYPRVVKARHRAMAVIRWSTEWSYPEIGRLFNRDHTTVMAGVEKYEAKINGERVSQSAPRAPRCGDPDRRLPSAERSGPGRRP